MTTLELSRQSSLFEISEGSPMPLSEVRLAKTPAPPTAKDVASTGIKRGSLLKQSALLENADLAGVLLKTVLSSELAAMTESRMAWKRSVTAAGRSWWQLVILERPTGANVSGSLLPTPAKQSQSGGLRLEGGSGGRKKLRQMMGSPRANKWGEPDSHGRTIGINGTAALHATYEWVMGYPLRWLANASAHTVMPSSRKSQKRSAGQSLASKRPDASSGS